MPVRTLKVVLVTVIIHPLLTRLSWTSECHLLRTRTADYYGQYGEVKLLLWPIRLSLYISACDCWTNTHLCSDLCVRPNEHTISCLIKNSNGCFWMISSGACWYWRISFKCSPDSVIYYYYFFKYSYIAHVVPSSVKLVLPVVQYQGHREHSEGGRHTVADLLGCLWALQHRRGLFWHLPVLVPLLLRRQGDQTFLD